VNRAHQRLGHLLGQSLLKLRAARVVIEEPSDAPQAHQRALGHVADVRLAEEGEQMMRAYGIERQARHHDHLSLALPVSHGDDIRFFQRRPSEELQKQLGHPLGRMPKLGIARRVQMQRL